MGHNQCCKNRRAPKTAKEFFALNYPPNPHGHDEVNNRVHNPEPVPVKFKKQIHKKIRKGWYFRIADEPFLLDGSGSGDPRGKVHGYEHKPPSKRPDVNPVNPGDRVVCFNAANLKMLAPKDPGGPLEPYGFTFTVPLTNGYAASGWMPLSSVRFKKNPTKNRAIMMASLRSWACCLERYARWGKSLTKKSKTYKFRSTVELAEYVREIVASPAKFKLHFKERARYSLRTPLKHAWRRAKADGGGDLEVAQWFRSVFGIFARNPGEERDTSRASGYRPGIGNKLGDYLPKPLKQGATEIAHTNLSANISIGKGGAITAPIALDIFPQDHEFHRLKFKSGKRAWGYLYSPTRNNRPGKVIGYAEWYYGYCDVNDQAAGAAWKSPYTKPTTTEGKKQRRYGWVPAMAVK